MVGAIESQARELLRAATPVGYRFRDAIWPYAAPASGEVADALVAAATGRGVPHVTGITAASPGFYGPSGRFMQGLSNTVPGIKDRLADLSCEGLRVVNMEMESSLIFHLADALGMRAGTICPVISNPARQDAVLDHTPHVADCIDIALEAMIELCQGPR